MSWVVPLSDPNVAFLRRKLNRKAALECAFILASWAIWFLFLRGNGEYFDQLRYEDIWTRVPLNVYDYATKYLPKAMFPMAGPGIAIGIVLAGIAFVYWWRRRDIVALYLAAYLGVVLMWPNGCSSERFLVPVLPFLFYGVAASVPDTWVREWAYVAAVLFAFACIGGLVFRKERSQGWDRYYEVIEKVKELPAESVVVCRKPHQVALETGRKAIRFPFDSRPEAQRRFLKDVGATHVVIDQLGFAQSSMKYLGTVARDTSLFRAAHITERPETLLLEVRR